MELDFHGLPQREEICVYINTDANSGLAAPVLALLCIEGGEASENQNKPCQQHCKEGEIQCFP